MTPVGARRVGLLLLAVSAAATALLVARRSYSIVLLVGAVALGSATYLLLTRREGPTGEPPQGGGAPPRESRLIRILPTAFFSLTALSLATLVPVLNEKPLAYYAFASASAGVLALFILESRTGRGSAFASGMVIVLAANLFGSGLVAFPVGLGGADSSTHIHFLVAPIVATGTIPTGADGVYEGCSLIYETFPAHHLLVASGSIVLGLDPAHAYYFLGFLVMLLPVIAAGSVARGIFGTRWGLLAALLVAGSSYIVGWAAHAAPITYSLPLIAANILVLLKLIEVRSGRLLLAAIPLGLALILTHPYSSIIYGIILIGIVGGHRLAERDFRISTWGPVVAGTTFAYTLLIDWTNFSCLVDKSFTLIDGWWGHLSQERLLASASVTDALPLQVIALNTLGDSFLFAFAAIGFLVMLRQKLSGRHMLILGPCVTLLALAAVGFLTRLEYILPNRVFVFMQFVGLAPLAAFGLGHLTIRAAGRWRVRRFSVATAAVLVGAVVFMSATSIIAGYETSPFYGGRPYVKLYDTNYEHAVADWMCAHGSSPTTVDTSLSLHGLARQAIIDCFETPQNAVGHIPVVRNGSIDVSRLDPGQLIVFSTYDLDPGFLLTTTGVGQSGSAVLARLDPAALADLDEFNRLYDSGRIQVFQVVP